MIAQVNAESNLPIKLDTVSVEKIIADEKLVPSTQAKNENDDTKQTTDEAPDGNVVQNEQETMTIDDVAKEATGASLDGPYITARALYVVPAKVSRRRGEKSGCAYFILTAPAPPPPTQPVNGGTSNTTLNGGTMMDVNSKVPNIDTHDAMDTEAAVVSLKEPVEATKVSTPTYSATEKSRLTSLAKLQLLQAIESLSALAEEDAKTAQLYGKCQVEASISGKGWRDKETRDRRDVNVENTNDYKLFFSKQVRTAEERQSRPKPLPGGGVGQGENGGDSDQKLAAIVLHLRAKHKEESNRKKVAKPPLKDTTSGKQQRHTAASVNNNAKKEVGKSRTNNNNHNNKGGNGAVVRGSKGRSTNAKKKSETAGVSTAAAPTKSLPKGSG